MNISEFHCFGFSFLKGVSDCFGLRDAVELFKNSDGSFKAVLKVVWLPSGGGSVAAFIDVIDGCVMINVTGAGFIGGCFGSRVSPNNYIHYRVDLCDPVVCPEFVAFLVLICAGGLGGME